MRKKNGKKKQKKLRVHVFADVRHQDKKDILCSQANFCACCGEPRARVCLISGGRTSLSTPFSCVL